MPRLLLERALVIAGRDAPARLTVALDGDRVAEVGPDVAPLPDDERVDCAGLLLTPGLIDAHTHLLSSGEPGGYEAELLHVSLPLRTLRGAAHLRAALDHGITTVRDVSTEGADFADVALRDGVSAGLVEGPRVVPSGPGIGITGGYLPDTYAPHVCAPHGCAIVDGPDACRREVRRQVAFGAEWIKVFADWPTRLPAGRGKAALPTFTTPELEAIVDEAARRGRKVAAHATSDAGAAHAVRCGVATIEHAGDLSRETLDAMAARGVFLVPTLTVLGHFLETATTDRVRDGMRRTLDVAAATIRRASEAGVRFVCGTDIGCFPHALGSRRELAWLRDFGLSAEAALWAATGEAGACLGIDGLGTLTVGAPADVCGFALPESGDPREVVWGAEKPRLVIARGRVARGAIPRDPPGSRPRSP